LAAENAATFAASGSPPGPGRRACKNASIWSSVLAKCTGALWVKISERWPSLPSRKLNPRSRRLQLSAAFRKLSPSEKRASTRDGFVKLRDFVISFAWSDGA